jgi:hypothetical protein
MKKIAILLILSASLLNCKTENKENSIPTNKISASLDTSILTNFLKDISSLESTSSKTPIADFIKIADQKANKKVTISKENMQEILTLANTYKNCVIITGNHTIVKIKDISDCKPSGSWNSCMPKAEGYVKKGALKKQEDYLNYIIGIPDTQIRIAYFFN